jgi:hypothetical protein
MSAYLKNLVNFDYDIICTPVKTQSADVDVEEKKAEAKVIFAKTSTRSPVKEKDIIKKAKIIASADALNKITELPIALNNLKPGYRTLFKSTKVGKKVVELKTYSKRTSAGALICFYFNGLKGVKTVYLCSRFPECENIARRGGVCKIHEAYIGEYSPSPLIL